MFYPLNYGGSWFWQGKSSNFLSNARYSPRKTPQKCAECCILGGQVCNICRFICSFALSKHYTDAKHRVNTFTDQCNLSELLMT